MSDADLLSRLRSALAELGRADTAPELPFLQLRRARIVVQKVDGRVSLQMVDRGDSAGPEAPDQIVLPVWMGVPGASADHTPGQEVLLAFASADAAQPIAFLAPPQGMAGAIPIALYLEATTEIRLVGGSAGVVKAGPGSTQKVALGPALEEFLDAVIQFATTAMTSTTDPTLVTAATALKLALTAPILPTPHPFPQTSADKLEAV